MTIISPNETELERLVQVAVTEDNIIELVKNKLLKKYSNLLVLLKLGSKGSMLISEKYELKIGIAPDYNP